MSGATVRQTTPGRVNLIGEHIDYNGGMVLPAALSVSLTTTLSPRKDKLIRISADGYDETAMRKLDEAAQRHWSDAATGALREAHSLGLIEHGADVHIASTIPRGSGLSSSAALIVSILKAARTHSGKDLSDTQIALAARRVENEYLGVPCGIMDQMAVAIAEPGQAIALDTETLTYSVVSLPATHTVSIIHSGQYRELTDGNYAARKLECDRAKAYFGTDNLCALKPDLIRSANGLDDAATARALHCATEHRRVLQAVEALTADDGEKFGALMNESHISMRDDFAISTARVDALVASAQELGASGARLTGGGFGGCIVALVETERHDAWLAALLDAHRQASAIDRITPG